MNILFLGLSFLSGLFGLSYEVIYQRIFLSIVGDLFGVYVMVVAAFILGMAIGNLVGFKLRPHLPLIEAASGLFAVCVAFFLRAGGYTADLPMAALLALLLFPAFAVGTAIPLYAYYGRQIRFQGIYAVYHLGAVAAILGIEFLLFPLFRQSTLLLALGTAHMGLGALVYWLYRRGIFHIAAPGPGRFSSFFSSQGAALAALFLFSFFSAYYHFWGLKASFYVLLPLRMISSIAVAAGLFWVFVGSFVPRLSRAPRGLTFYGAGFSAHLLLVLGSTFYLPRAIPFLFMFGNEAGFSLIIFYFLAPCLWASAYLVSLAGQWTKDEPERTDEISGYVLFVSAIGNVCGFVLALFMGFVIDKTLYFLPIYFLFLLPLGAVSARRIVYAGSLKSLAVCGLLLVLFVGATLGLARPRDVNANLLASGTFVRRALDIAKTVSPEATFLQKAFFRHEALVGSFSGVDHRIDQAIVYPSAQATVTLLPFEQRPIVPVGLPPTFLPTQGARDTLYMIEGYWSHTLSTPAEYTVGFLPRLYFDRPVSDALVVGVGSGETSSGVSMISRRTDLVEISDNILKVMDDLRDYNNDVKNRPGVRVIRDDAMNYLKRADKKYEAIVNTSSAQYTVWAAKLYSEEFLNLIKAHLTESGVYVTWVDSTSFSRRETFLSYLAFLKKHFAFVDIHKIRDSYVCFVAYNRPRGTIGFSYDMLASADRNYLGPRPALRPHEAAINRSYARNVTTADGVASLAPTLDRPMVEIEAVKNLLAYPSYEGPRPESFFMKDEEKQSDFIYDSIFRAIEDPEAKDGAKPKLL